MGTEEGRPTERERSTHVILTHGYGCRFNTTCTPLPLLRLSLPLQRNILQNGELAAHGNMG